MRYVNGFVCMMLALFAIAQYNDPDVLLWFLIYAIPAAWAGFVAFLPGRLPASHATTVAYLVCLAAAVAGTVYMWPSLPPDWIHVEEEREGLGLTIVTTAFLVVGWTWWRQSRSLSPRRTAPH